MGEEWGPWVEHDGNHCPVGEYVNAVCFDGDEWFCVAGREDGALDPRYSAWLFEIDNPEADHVFKYRIRKPKGLTILGEILREVEREPEVV